MTKHKKNEAIGSEKFEHIGSTAIQDTDGKEYLLTLWAACTERPRYCLDISRQNNPQKELSFWVYPLSLQKLTAWFAKLVPRVSKHEEETRGSVRLDSE
jgi:hypothetical protein